MIFNATELPMPRFSTPILLCTALLIACVSASAGDSTALDEFKVKRQDVFEFTQKPAVTHEGKNFTITFESKGFCDATVAVEDAQGKIVRHLASGVLGPRAPEPFQKDSLKQSIVWDGKNDKEEYITDTESLTVRVSLGLKPAFEKNLLWEPKRRHGWAAPRFQVTQDGVYVYDGGNGLDFVNLFNHDGNYTKAIYPFPGNKIEEVKGLAHETFPQDGQSLPVKSTFLQQTFLTCGNLYGHAYPKKFAIDAEQADGEGHYGMYGSASSILAVGGSRLALGKTYLARFATDGSSGGMEEEGPPISLVTVGKSWDSGGKKVAVAPRSAALSPDGKTLYLTAYLVGHFSHASADIVGGGTWDAFHCVLKMNMDGETPPVLFAGNMELGKPGTDNKSFNTPASVAVDKTGRVYVADYGNNRIQIFSADGAYLKSLAVTRPAIVSIAPQSQEIYAFSSFVHTGGVPEKDKVACAMTVFTPFDNAAKKLSCPLPEGMGSTDASFWYSGQGAPLSAAVDDFTTPPTVWFSTEWRRENVLTRGKMENRGVELYTLENDKFKKKRSFVDDVVKSIKRTDAPRYGRSRLYVNPVNGHVYVAEGDAFDYKSFKSVLELDPETGSIEVRPIPFDAEDMCFDSDGMMYLRSIDMVARYDPSNWREIPWDYGDERATVFTSASNDRKEAALVSGLTIPSDGGWHHGGMYVSPKGNLVVSCGLHIVENTDKGDAGAVVVKAVNYKPQIYPGRCVDGRAGAPLLHIWDKHGKQLAIDVLPGLGGAIYGVGLDHENNVYLMSSNSRVIDGKVYQNHLTGTMIKVAPHKAKILSMSGTPIALGNLQPTRPPDLVGAASGNSWIEGADWMYGGVGYDGKNAGVGCGCWNARFAFDYFNRSFAPEIDRYRVAVLDGNGNLILRIGKYGNADSAGEKSLVPMGGDEVGMVHGAYIATATDHRLFIADVSTDRIFSVKLGYHQNESVPLKSAR